MTQTSTEQLTVEEVAERLQTTPEAIRKRIRRHSLHAVKVGPRWLIPWPQAIGQAAGQDTGHPQAAPKPKDSPRIAHLEQEIAHLKERLAETQQERDRLAAALTQAQQALLNQQSLSLPAAVKEMKAIPSPEQTKEKRPWWKVW